MGNHWTSYPFARTFLAFVSGLLMANWLTMSHLSTYLVIIGVAFLAYLFLLRVFRDSFYTVQGTAGIITLLLFVSLGNMRAYLNTPLTHEAHYRKAIINMEGWQCNIVKPGIEKENYVLYECEVCTTYSQAMASPSIGIVNFYVKKDSLAPMLHYGDRVLVMGAPFPIPAPKNPNEFNYAGYMHMQHIYDQQFVRHDQIKVIDQRPNYQIIDLGYKIRHYFKGLIDRHIPGKQENAVLSALLLGIKDHLDREISGAYAAAGAMHVLAVSGLHVGIIYMILYFLLAPLRKTVVGKWVQMVVFLTGLWAYAMVTGFSPSVLRAVAMFSLVIIADTTVRKSNIYNTISLSALLLLIYEPNLIYAVGFQLSYAAVLGIIYLQPRIYALWVPHNKYVDWAWNITAVSLAAQIATFPMGLYYFHQFPTYFLFSNLFVIPAVGIILYSGLGFLLLAAIADFLGEYAGWILTWELRILNIGVVWIEKLPGSLLDWAHLDGLQLALLLLIILTVIAIFHYQEIRWVYGLFVVSVIWAGWHIYQLDLVKEKRAIIHFAVRNTFAMDIADGENALLIADSSFLQSGLPQFQINPYRLASLLPPTQQPTTQMSVLHELIDDGMEIWYWQGKKILRLSAPLTKELRYDSLECHHLIVSNNAIRRPEELDMIKYELAVFDGSCRRRNNYPDSLWHSRNAYFLHETGAVVRYVD